MHTEHLTSEIITQSQTTLHHVKHIHIHTHMVNKMITILYKASGNLAQDQNCDGGRYSPIMVYTGRLRQDWHFSGLIYGKG